MKRTLKSKTGGFTLVELLIVVAIIGVLATIGVPTFQKMTQKAKKSEAKVALGAFYTVEAAFFSEYGTYSDNIKALGFELEGNQTNRIYATGFTDASCNQLSSGATVSQMPGSSTTIGTALAVAYPAYYSAANFAQYIPAGAPNHPTANCQVGTIDAAAGLSFIAAASGTISPKSGAPVDTWTINEARTLSNVTDGLY